MTPVLGCIADDFTGATDLANTLTRQGMCTVVLLGVPREDEPRFRGWSSALVRTLDPKESLSEAEVQQAVQSRTQMREYMNQLSATRRAHPQDDLFSGLLAGST